MPTPTNGQIISALYVATFDRAPDKPVSTSGSIIYR